MKKNRIAYFGTIDGPGHKAIGIQVTFTQRELEVFEKVDCSAFDDIVKSTTQLTLFTHGWGWMAAAFPASPNDKRRGSKTCVFVEGARTYQDFLTAIRNDPSLNKQFSALAQRFEFDLDTYTPPQPSRAPARKGKTKK